MEKKCPGIRQAYWCMVVIKGCVHVNINKCIFILISADLECSNKKIFGLRVFGWKRHFNTSFLCLFDWFYYFHYSSLENLAIWLCCRLNGWMYIRMRGWSECRRKPLIEILKRLIIFLGCFPIFWTFFCLLSLKSDLDFCKALVAKTDSCYNVFGKYCPMILSITGFYSFICSFLIRMRKNL